MDAVSYLAASLGEGVDAPGELIQLALHGGGTGDSGGLQRLIHRVEGRFEVVGGGAECLGALNRLELSR